MVKSYLNDEDMRIFGNNNRHSVSGDPDLDTAFDELNEYLKQDKTGGADPGRGSRSGANNRNESGGRPVKTIGEELRPDFAELGVAFNASADECKAAYKKLLKIHHPDRHAGHEGNFKKATDKTARINAAYDRIEKWRRDTSESR